MPWANSVPDVQNMSSEAKSPAERDNRLMLGGFSISGLLVRVQY